MKQAVQDGRTAPGSAYTVAICYGEGPGTCSYVCSGTLIGSNLVLTTRHCVAGISDRFVNCETDRFENVRPPELHWVTVNADMENRATGWFQTFETLVPPDQDFCGNDIALLILKEAIPSSQGVTITPLLEGTQVTQDRFGGTVTALGYGSTSFFGRDFGTRRIRPNIPVTCFGETASECDEVAASKLKGTEFMVAGGLCEGDSGGSAIDPRSLEAQNPLVVGVLSRASNKINECVDDIFVRTDLWGRFIAKSARRAALVGQYDAPAWATTPNLTRLGPLGDHCGEGADCESSVCGSPDGGLHYVCTQPCPCPDDFECLGDGASAKCFKKVDKVVRKQKPLEESCAVALGPSAPGPKAIGASLLVPLVAAVRRTRRRISRYAS